MTKKYDLIVIGAGPAGEKGAAKAAQHGKRVALIERAPFRGGAGINTGTVPSKTPRMMDWQIMRSDSKQTKNDR